MSLFPATDFSTLQLGFIAALHEFSEMRVSNLNPRSFALCCWSLSLVGSNFSELTFKARTVLPWMKGSIELALDRR